MRVRHPRGAWLLTGSTSFIIANISLGVTNLAFHVILGRIVGPSEYGILASLLTLIVAISVPLNALQAAVTQRVAEATTRVSIRVLTLQTALWASGAMILLWALSYPIATFLNLGTIWYVVIVGSVIPPLAIAAVIQGLLLAEGKYLPVALSQGFGAGFVRVLSAVLLVVSGLGVGGAIFASCISAWAQILFLMPAVRDYWSGDSAISLKLADGGRSVLAIGATTLLTTIDSWLARHFLAAQPAGLFVSAATVGRMPLFLPGAILLVMFPRLVRRRADRMGSVRLLAGNLAAVVGIGVTVVVVVALRPHDVLHILFGRAFGGASTILIVVCTAQLLVGPITVLIYGMLAQKSWLALLGWLACLGQFVAATLYHANAQDLSYDLLITNGSCLLFLLAASAVVLRRVPAGSVYPMAQVPRTHEVLPPITEPKHGSGGST